MDKLKSYLPYLLIFIVAIFMGKSCNKEPKPIISTPDRTVEVKLVTKIDTVYKPRNIYVHDTIKVPTVVQVLDTIRDKSTKEIVKIPAIRRVYQDSAKVEDSVYIAYKAKTTGTLDNIELSYSNRKSIMAIHKQDSIIKNTTITKYPGGLYVGVTAGLQELSPTIQYTKDKSSFGLKYNIINQGVGVTYTRKIF